MTYYIRHENTYFKLDATQQITVTYPSRVTSHPTQDKQTQSDGIINDNPTASYTGFITDVQTPTSHNTFGAGGYIDKLLATRGTRTTVALKHRLDGEEEDGWAITSFVSKQTNRNGFGGVKQDGSIVQSFEVSFTMERLSISGSIDVTFSVESKYADDFQPEKESSGATEELLPEDVTSSEHASLRKAKIIGERAGLIKRLLGGNSS